MTDCDAWRWLGAALGDDAPAADARRADVHLATCQSCRERHRSREPMAMLRHLPRRTLPASEWDAVWAAVREEMEATKPGVGADLRWPRWLAPMAMAASLVLTAGLSFWRGVPAPTVQIRLPSADEADARGSTESGGSFAYLSNPQAVVAHVFVAGDGADEAIPLTMVIDERLADLF